MVDVLLIGLRVNWLLSRGSAGWGGLRQRCGSSTAGSELPTVQLCDLWKPSARHNMTSPFMSHQLKRNPTTIIHQPIKKLCIIYHVIWQFNQIEYNLQLVLGIFFLHARTRKEKYDCNLIPSITLTLNFILHALRDSTFVEVINIPLQKCDGNFLNTRPLMTKLKNLPSPLCKASTKEASYLWNESNLNGRAIPDY